jgi:VanZ family protein
LPGRESGALAEAGSAPPAADAGAGGYDSAWYIEVDGTMNLRPLTFLCIAYVAFLLYASLMPFDLRADAAMVSSHYRQAWTIWPFGPMRASRSDLLSNTMVYVPLGLLIATRLRLAGVYRLLALLAAVEGAMVTGLTVEGLQLLSASRIGQATDVLTNTTGGLLGASFAGHGRRRYVLGATCAVSFALLVEAARIFFVSNRANAAHVAVAACGSAVGAIAAAGLSGRLSLSAKRIVALVLLVGFIAYIEWQPFVFVLDAAAVARKLPRGASLLPLYHYAMGGRAEDVRLFVRSVVLLAAAAVAVLWVPGRPKGRRSILLAALLAGGLGLVFEAGQLLIPSRVPSTTDVFCFALGGAVGAWLTNALLRKIHTPG